MRPEPPGQLAGDVGTLPREPAVVLGGTPEMAVGRRPGVDRAIEPEMVAYAARGEIDEFAQRARQLRVVDPARADRLDVERGGFGDADRLGKQDNPFPGHARLQDLLPTVARGA